LALLRDFDLEFRWYTITANRDPAVLKQLLFSEHTLPGFNDSGAHLANMAYYDGNLRTLKLAAEESVALVSRAVKRLTKDPADLFNLDAGTLDLGQQADMVLIDPAALLSYDSEACTQLIHRELFDCNQFVNRSDGVVTATIIGGKVAWENGAYAPQFGRAAFGRTLRDKRVPHAAIASRESATPARRHG